jgi:tetratricopeptide (TPR) repeat protein
MNRTANNAIKVKYDGMNNITYECLKRGVIYADIGFDKADLVMDIVPARHYEGKTPNGEAKIGFVISIKFNSVCPELQNKVVFEIDGERMEMEASEERISKHSYRAFDEECNYSSEEITGINGYAVNNTVYINMMFDLQPKDIQRIAEAKNVCIYFDSNGEYNVNGGTIALRNGNGSCQIEGIQWAMKRAYHYYVDFANSDEDAELKKAQEAYDNKDYETALSIWNRLAERNNAVAICKIGVCYGYGQGVPQDYDEAIKWFRKAADLGDVTAMLNLSAYYDETQNEAEAFKWYRKAAELGDVYSISCIAYCYETGYGVSVDLAEALKWYRKAKELGDDTEAHIQRIESKLKPTAITTHDCQKIPNLPKAVFEKAWVTQDNEQTIGVHWSLHIENQRGKVVSFKCVTRSLSPGSTFDKSTDVIQVHEEKSAALNWDDTRWDDWRYLLNESDIKNKLRFEDYPFELQTELFAYDSSNNCLGSYWIRYKVVYELRVFKNNRLLLANQDKKAFNEQINEMTVELERISKEIEELTNKVQK